MDTDDAAGLMGALGTGEMETEALLEEPNSVTDTIALMLALAWIGPSLYIWWYGDAPLPPPQPQRELPANHPRVPMADHPCDAALRAATGTGAVWRAGLVGTLVALGAAAWWWARRHEGIALPSRTPAWLRRWVGGRDSVTPGQRVKVVHDGVETELTVPGPPPGPPPGTRGVDPLPEKYNLPPWERPGAVWPPPGCDDAIGGDGS